MTLSDERRELARAAADAVARIDTAGGNRRLRRSYEDFAEALEARLAEALAAETRGAVMVHKPVETWHQQQARDMIRALL